MMLKHQIKFDNVFDCVRVKSAMQHAIEAYGWVTVSDVYDLVEITDPNVMTNTSIGWDDISKGAILSDPIDGKCVFILPAPKPIKFTADYTEFEDYGMSISFDTVKEGEVYYGKLVDIFNACGTISMSDVSALLNKIPKSYADGLRGWDNIDSIKIVRSKYGPIPFMLTFPAPIKLIRRPAYLTTKSVESEKKTVRPDNKLTDLKQALQYAVNIINHVDGLIVNENKEKEDK